MGSILSVRTEEASNLSWAKSAVAVVKEIVRALDFGEVTGDARRALEAATPEEVHKIGAARIQAAGLLDQPDLGDWLRVTVDKHTG